MLQDLVENILLLKESSIKMVVQNRTWMTYPSQDIGPETNIEDIIESQNIISRVMHFHIAFLVPLGLLAGICILISLGRLYHSQKALGKLDICLFDLAITDITILLFSLTAVTRPDYLEMTNLKCGVLAFFFNISYFNSQYLQVILIFLFLLHKDIPTNQLLIKIWQKPLLSVSLTLVLAICSSLIVVALLGTVQHLHEPTLCQLDPLNASPKSDITKFCLGLVIPSFFNTLLLVVICIKLAKIKDVTWKEISKIGRILLPISTIMFTCRLFYNIMFLSRTMFKLKRLNGTTRDELIFNIAELVMFSQSCFSLIIMLFLHKPCMDWLRQMCVLLTKRCQRNGTTNVAVAEDPSAAVENENIALSSHEENDATNLPEVQ